MSVREGEEKEEEWRGEDQGRGRRPCLSQPPAPSRWRQETARRAPDHGGGDTQRGRTREQVRVVGGGLGCGGLARWARGHSAPLQILMPFPFLL